MRAHRDGVPYEPGDPVWDITEAMSLASFKDPDVLRAFVEIVTMISLPDQAIAAPGVLEKVLALGTGDAAAAGAPPGPTRAELLAIVGA
jgi:hypothetical protein